MLEALALDCAFERDRIVAFIREELAQAGFSRLVMGMSGGIDSALVAALGVEALGAENVLGLMLPYRTSNPDSEAHARLAMAKIGTPGHSMPLERIDISGMVDALEAASPGMNAGRKGNAMARFRMATLYDRSVAFGGLVVGTSNATETLLGYFTLFGDGAAAIKPIAHLYKCQVRQLSAFMDVPDVIINKAPSADLWAGQTDEGELGFSYDDADQVLYLAVDQKQTREAIIATGFEAVVVDAILRRMHSTGFKRRQPPTLLDR